MALQFLDRQRVIGYIMDAWQKHLKTEADPSGGGWFSNGPGNNGGLYGKLEDKLFSDLVYGEPTKKLAHPDIAFSTECDNRNGTQPVAEPVVRFKYSNNETVSHAVSKTVKGSASWEIKNAIGKVTLGTEYAQQWKDENEKTKSVTVEFEEKVPVKIPEGRVYKLVVTHDVEQTTTPYEAHVRITGTSTANFGQAVLDEKEKAWKKTHDATAGELCEWINQKNSAGDESKNFKKDPQNPDEGICVLHGEITADVSHNFSSVIYDVTGLTRGDSLAAAPVVEEKPLTGRQMRP